MAKKIRIPIKSAADIKKMRIACETASEILQLCAKEVQPGRTTAEIDAYAAELMKERDCKSAFLGYRGFPVKFVFLAMRKWFMALAQIRSLS